MKSVFLLLLAGNLAYFTWQFWHYETGTKELTPSPPADIRLPGTVNRLLLLSEIDTDELRLRAGPRVRTINAQDVTSAATPTYCHTIGPLPGQDDIDKVKAWMTARGFQVTLRTGKRREVPLYWAYLPPFPTLKGARQQAARMKKDGIKDLFVLPRGDMANAISLGVFSKKETLKARVAALERKGYDPAFGAHYRTEKSTWFETAPLEKGRLPEAALLEAFPKLTVTTPACKASDPADPSSTSPTP